MQTPQKNKTGLSLRWVSLVTGFLGALVLLGGILLKKGPLFCWGVVLGNVLAVVGFVFLAKIVSKMLDPHYRRKKLMGFLFFLKLVFVITIMLVAFVVLEKQMTGFILGYMVFIPVVLGWQFVQKHFQ